MFPYFAPDFVKLSRELNALRRRDVTQGVKLAKYKKSARSLMKKDPVSANTLLGLVACLEHDLPSMHLYHKKAIELSESSFTLMFYAASLHKSCLWDESAKYLLSALDHEPTNLHILDRAIQIVPLTGRFPLLKKLLEQRQELEQTPARKTRQSVIQFLFALVPKLQLGNARTRKAPALPQAKRSVTTPDQVSRLLSRHGLQEKDLKAVVTAIGDALSETEVILENFTYELVMNEPDTSFLHYRFLIPDQFVASNYENLVAARLQSVELHPRIFDVFSFSMENSAFYELYVYMEKELADSADTVRVPDPEKMKLIEELVDGVEI
jgi:hypothetical protein